MTKHPSPIEEQQHYALSHKQRGKALIASLERRCLLPILKNEISAFNILVERQYHGLDQKIFEKALYALIQRHEGLRTVFIEIDGEIRQKLLEAGVCMKQYSFSNVSAQPEPNKRAEELVRSLVDTDFKFFQGPPFKATCIQVGDSDYIVALVVNHIAFDFYSGRVIEEEFNIMYEAILTGSTPDLTPLPVQVKDFAAWESSAVNDTSPGNYGEVWMHRLQGDIQKYVLRDHMKDGDAVLEDLSYAEFIEKEVKKNFSSVSKAEIEKLKGVVHRAHAHEGASYRFVITQEVCKELKNVGVRCRATLFGVFTAVFFILLYRLSGVKRLVIGSESAIRDSDALTNVVGWLANTVLLRATVEENMPVSQFIQSVFRESQDAARFKIFPFERVLQGLDMPLDAIGGLYVNITTYAGAGGEQIVDFQPRHNQNDKPYFDFDCFATVFDNGAEIMFRYKTELFNADQIVNFSTIFQGILMEIISNKELTLSAFSPHDAKPMAKQLAFD